MIGRESELKALIDRYDSGRFEMIPVMGRRRVGKTTLLQEFAKGRNGVYFSATRGSLEANIAKLASRVLGTPSPVRMSIDELFDEIKRRSADERYLLIIDEYPYMVRKDERFSDALQEFIDEIEGDSKLFLILCGSSMSMMKHQVLSSKAPLYGRRTGQLELKPMEIWDVREMLGGFCDEDVIRIYGMVGGIPLYLKMFDPAQTMVENVRRLFLEDASFFRCEHEFVLMEEFDTPFTYYSILEALSSGHNRTHDIATCCSLDDSTVHKHLASLTSTSFVERIVPVDNPNGKAALYRIADRFLRFQFGRVLPVVDYGNPEDADRIARSILEGLEKDMGSVFEEICGQHLFRMHGGRLGKWWGADPVKRTQEEIDLVLTSKEDGKTAGWFAECKYKGEPVGADVLETLRRRASLVKGFDGARFAIYSKSGFTGNLRESGNVELYDLNDVLTRPR